jgi:predicted nucleic acid-binding protein
MPIVVDTTVFRYLVVLEVTDILPTLFGRVLIPPAVFNELQQASTPAIVRTWSANLPSWVRIQSPPLLITDDHQAYKAALARSLPVTRTLRVLEMAAERGLLDFPTIVARLRAAGFYTPEDVVEEMLARDAERKRQQSTHQEQR